MLLTQYIRVSAIVCILVSSNATAEDFRAKFNAPSESQRTAILNGLIEDQSQPVQQDTVAVSDQIWVGQLIQQSKENISAVRLFLDGAREYAVEVRSNSAGYPGNVLHRTIFTSGPVGNQYVPIWIPENIGSFWLVVKGTSGSSPSLGVSAEGKQPYFAKFLTTTDSGANWQESVRNLAFTTYEWGG